MNEESLKEQLLATYKVYMKGFKSNNIKLIDSIVKYPIAFLKNGIVEMFDNYPIDPKKLRTEKDWDHSKNWNFDILAINNHHAHAVASAIRCRADGSVIEHVHGFYAFIKINNLWKMYAFSEVVS